MTDYEMRKKIWIVVSELFNEVDELDFIWIYNSDDFAEANTLPDGTGVECCCSGVVRGVV
jgi:hypothetical protein